MKTRLMSVLALLMMGAGAEGAAALPAAPTTEAAAAAWTPYEVVTTALPGGMVRGELLDGRSVVARFVARAGTTVNVTEAVTPEGMRVVDGIGLLPPDAANYEDTVRMAEAFGEGLLQVRAFAQEAGIPFDVPRQASEDAIPPCGFPCEDIKAFIGSHGLPDGPSIDDVGEILYGPGEEGGEEERRPTSVEPGIDPPFTGNTPITIDTGADDTQPQGSIWDSGCVEIENSKANWQGCYTRWTVNDRDPGFWYSGDESQASGNATFWYQLRKGSTDHRYGNGEVVRWNPGATLTKSGSRPCRVETLSLGYSGTGLSRAHEVCPDRIDPHRETARFKTTWSGHTDDEVVQATAQDFVKMADGSSSTFEYWISVTWQWG